ncbi:MAG: HPF/RaiA family ribosome-associated protein [Candidatus Krumholzibacteriia bacterium]
MQVPLELSFRGIENTGDVETLVRDKVEKLEEITDRLISCRVAVERTQESQRSGNPYGIRIEIRVPGSSEIIVRESVDADDSREPLATLVRAGFNTARRQLREAIARQRGQEKLHLTPDKAAVVAKLFPDRDYGFLETLDRREIFFHRNSVLNDDFDRLEVGTGVRFEEEEGEEGPQASSLRIVDKPGVSSPRAAEAAEGAARAAEREAGEPGGA